MPKRLLDFDPLTGIKTYHQYDHATRTTTIGYEQDVEHILDYNKALESLDDGYVDKEKSMKRVASIPVVVQMQWLKEGIDVWDKNDWPAVKRKLNDPEYRYLRTAPGRV